MVSSGVEVSEKLSEKVLSLPMYPYLSEDSIFNICKNIEDIILKNNEKKNYFYSPRQFISFF